MGGHMWGSALIGDTYDNPIDIGDESTENIIGILAQHPNFSNTQFTIQKTTSSLVTSSLIKSYSFPINGDGWFEAVVGRPADDMIKSLRKMRRHNKNIRSEIDGMITDIRTLKALESQVTLDNISWADDYHSTIKMLGLSDRQLKALRKFGEVRSSSLIQACDLYKHADKALKMLDEHEDVWGIEEENAWANAMRKRGDAKKMWKSTLHQIDKLTKHEQKIIKFIASELEEHGPMTGRVLVERGLSKGFMKRAITPSKIGMLLKMYGEEADIYKGVERGTFVKLNHDGLVIKDVWAYAAGFLDADGTIFITDRGEPRASFVATGSRGKAHCEQMYKALECGTLALNQRISKNSKRSTHRLLFSSKRDLQKLLKGVLPHLKMKKMQAKAVLAYIDVDDNIRKTELKRLVTYENWKDDKSKANQYLQIWGIEQDSISKYAEGL